MCRDHLYGDEKYEANENQHNKKRKLSLTEFTHNENSFKRKRSMSIDTGMYSMEYNDDFMSSKRRKNSVYKNMDDGVNFKLYEFNSEPDYGWHRSDEVEMFEEFQKSKIKEKNHSIKSEIKMLGKGEKNSDDCQIFKNNKEIDIISEINNKFISKEYSLNFEYKSLVFLREIIYKFPQKNKFGEKFQKEKKESVFEDEFLNSKAFEILLLYFKRKLYTKKIFLRVFCRKDIIRFVEHLQTENNGKLTAIINILQCVICKLRCFLSCIKSTVFNEIILFLEKERSEKGIVELINLIYIFLLKEKFDNDDEAMKFYTNCILPLLENNTLELLAEKSIIRIFDLFLQQNNDFVHISIKFIHNKFPILPSKSKSLLFVVFHNILKNHIASDMNRKAIDTICYMSTIMLESLHHVLIDNFYNFFVDVETQFIIESNIKIILPKIFSSFYNTLKIYWCEHEKAKLYRILYMWMQIDKKLFDRCLTEYNKNSVKNKLIKNQNDDLTAEMFTSCINVDIDPEKIKKMRRQSLLPVENEPNKFLYEIEENEGN